MNNFINALYKLYPQTVRTVGDDAFDVDGNPVVYDKVLVQAEVDRTAYITLRAAAYPSFADQFDTIFHGGLDAWKAEIQAVKTQFPKGE